MELITLYYCATLDFRKSVILDTEQFEAKEDPDPEILYKNPIGTIATTSSYASPFVSIKALRAYRELLWYS
jgi:hypothetical protein